MLHEGKLGIHPPGALGVGFFMHAEADCFIGRSGGGITEIIKKAGGLNLSCDGKPRWVSIRGRVFSNLLEADALDRLPELMFVCCNPDQLGVLTREMTRFIENLAQRGRLRNPEDIRRCVPILLVLPNGILLEQTSETYDEQLHESLLMHRLPSINEEMIGVLRDRIVRGIALQAGGRQGDGEKTVYLLEKKGSVVFAGGGENERERIEEILTAHEYPYKHARGVPGTRIEFDKAMISIVLNAGGLIHATKPSGELTDLRMGDLCKDPSKAQFVEQITRAVFDVGLAVGAYPSDARHEDIWAAHRATIMSFAGHVTSSLKCFRDALARGLDTVKLFPNEEWVLSPLARYAARVGLHAEEALFGSLRREVQESMAKAIRYRDQKSEETGSRTNTMKLTAQRNISIEMFEAGKDEMVLVGTMLDDEHLIKLELVIYLPDEQITKSKLHMVRVPFPVCREVESIAERLVGLQISRGVLNEISARVGGHVGCSHIKELATNIVYFAASSLVKRRVGVDPMSLNYIHKLPEERFTLTKELLRGSCLAYCQTTPQGLDEDIGIRRVGEDHVHPLPLGQYEPSLGVLLQDRAKRFSEKVYLRWRDNEDCGLEIGDSRLGNRKQSLTSGEKGNPQSSIANRQSPIPNLQSSYQERSLTLGEFADQTFQISRHLIEMGIRPGDRVGVISENRAEMYLFELAAMSIGAISVPVFAGYPPPQVAYVLGNARPRFVAVSGAHQLEKIERKHFPWVEKYFCMAADHDTRKWGAIDFSALLDKGGASQRLLQERIDNVQPDDVCMIMYTSGTTGPPKGVRLKHHNLISQQKAISLIWDVDENDVFMSYLPWHHSFGGLFERFMTLYNGCQLCLDGSRGRDIDRQIENWKAFRPTIFLSVPRVHDTIVSRCREDPEAEKAVFRDRLRFVFTAGAPLPAPVEAVYRAHGVPVLEGWGLTETSPCVTVTTKDSAWRSGFVGFPIPGVKVRIESDQEILVHGPNVMEGYHQDEEATAHRIDDEGWFRTGDLGEFTKDGLRIFGRKDGAFKLTTGEKVHPFRIENVLANESPYISLAVVVGSGKDFVGALIYPNLKRLREWAAQNNMPTEGLLDQQAVHDLYGAELRRINPKIEVKFQRIRRAVLAEKEPTLADDELTPSGKLVRKTALKKYHGKIEALFAPKPTPNVIEVQERELQRT